MSSCYDESASIARLANGKFASIYCLRIAEKFVAVKKYNREFSISHGKIERIMAEKSVLLSLKDSSPYIVDLIATDKDTTSLYFVMDFIIGGRLDKHIRSASHARLDVDIAMRYSAEIVSALIHMGSHGCAHRDIKASNVALTSEGHVKVIDFGSSKRLFGGEDYDVIVKQRQVVEAPVTYTITGSTHCMAPEMVAQKIGPGHTLLVDWWALGTLIHEMICGVFAAVNPRLLSGAEERLGPDSESSLPSEEDSRVAAAVISRQRAQISTGDEFFPTGLSEILLSAPSSPPSPWVLVLDSHTRACYEVSDLAAQGRDLVQRLLVAAPELRLGLWNVEAVLTHPFFGSVVWEDVHMGRAPPPNIAFDRRVGNFDIVDRFSDKDEITESEQALFAGF